MQAESGSGAGVLDNARGEDQAADKADTLSERLEAVLHDKFAPRAGINFDADTPIDKTLNMLQSIIAVSNNLMVKLPTTRVAGEQDYNIHTVQIFARQRPYPMWEHHLSEHAKFAPRSGIICDANTPTCETLTCCSPP